MVVLWEPVAEEARYNAFRGGGKGGGSAGRNKVGKMRNVLASGRIPTGEIRGGSKRQQKYVGKIWYRYARNTIYQHILRCIFGAVILAENVVV